MLIGYARVSTGDQNIQMQLDALERAGCEKIYKDENVRGNATLKPQLNELLKFAREGDTVVIWKMDRLSRSLHDLIELVGKLEKRGLQFRSLTEEIQTDTPSGKLFFHMMGALAEFERDVIKQRTIEGMKVAKAAGKPVGRPPAISEADWKDIKGMLEQDVPIAKIARLKQISRQTIYTRIQSDQSNSE